MRESLMDYEHAHLDPSIGLLQRRLEISAHRVPSMLCKTLSSTASELNTVLPDKAEGRAQSGDVQVLLCSCRALVPQCLLLSDAMDE